MKCKHCGTDLAWFVSPMAAMAVEVNRLRNKLTDETRFCSGEWPCEASTTAASLERERNELREALLRMALVMPTSNAYVVTHREYQDAFKIAFKALGIPWPETASGTLTGCDRDDALAVLTQEQ